MAHNQFYWWRRSHKRPTLKRKDAFKGKSFLLQQIQNGDFDYSDYANQAKQELPILEDKLNKLKSSFKGGEDSLKEEEDNIVRKSCMRVNRLLKDHHEEEQRLLSTLKDSLIKEFGSDVWEQSLQDVDEGTLEDLYAVYQENVKKFDI